MQILLVVVHAVICFFLIIVVLLQSGKAADLAGAFGGMGSQTAFGPRGAATVLSKATTIAAVLFMITSITLTILATRSGRVGGGSVLEKQRSTTKTTPGKPGPGPAGIPAQPGKPFEVQVQPIPEGGAAPAAGQQQIPAPPAQAPQHAPAPAHNAPAPGHNPPAPGHSTPAEKK